MFKLVYNQYAMFFLPWFFNLTFCGILKPYKNEENLTVQLFYELRLLIKLFSFDSFGCFRKYHSSSILYENMYFQDFRKLKHFRQFSSMFYGSSLNINKNTLKFYAFKYAEIKMKLQKYSNQFAEAILCFRKIILLKISYESIFLQRVNSYNPYVCIWIIYTHKAMNTHAYNVLLVFKYGIQQINRLASGDSHYYFPQVILYVILDFWE